jgi:hypothetical protein
VEKTLSGEARQLFWLAHVQAWQQSGLTQAAYCQQQQLITHRMSYWVIRAKELNTPTVTFVPGTVLPSMPEGPIVLNSPSGWQLALPAHVAPQWIAQLLQQLP